MPRRARLSIAGIPWHIIQRGNNHAACFFSDEDYLYYLEHLKLRAQECGCVIHAYCLMTNHVHLLLSPQKVDSASQLMKHLGQRYVQYINRKYRRSGTLWDGRFKSCLVQEERYLLSCYRYIEMNPVRAAMVSHPADYRWSSYRCNGLGISCGLIIPHACYEAMGRTLSARSRAYNALFRGELDEDCLSGIRVATNGNYVLGDGAFEREMELALGRRVRPGQSGRPTR